MPTSPTSYYNRLTGIEAFTDKLTFTGGFTAPASAATIQGYGLVVVPAATTTLTLSPSLHAGMVVCIQSTGGLTITPAPATGTGNEYTVAVIVTPSGGNVTIDFKLANASDLIQGVTSIGATTSGTFATATNSNLVTWNAGTTGGIVGTWFQWVDAASHVNIITDGSIVGSSTAATCFSNH